MIKQLHSNNDKKCIRSFVYLVFIDGVYKKQFSKPGVLENKINLNHGVCSITVSSNSNVFLRILNVKAGYKHSCFENPNFKLITCSPDSELVILQSFHGPDNCLYYNRSSMKVELKKNSKATIYNIVDEGNRSSHAGSLFATQDYNTNLKTYRLTGRGGIINDSVTSVLYDEKAKFASMGLYVSKLQEKRIMSGKAHHLSSNTTSNQVYNGIADGFSSCSFLGEILIDSGIKNIEAHQKNKNLMISENCSMSSHPELRIDSDSVQCSHGSTVGQIDKDAMFYMKSRGIASEVAKKILVESFRNSIIKDISDKYILKHVDELTQRK